MINEYLNVSETRISFVKINDYSVGDRVNVIVKKSCDITPGYICMFLNSELKTKCLLPIWEIPININIKKIIGKTYTAKLVRVNNEKGYYDITLKV